MSGRRKPTSTSAFGVGRRESHDASGFYARFTPPALSDDAQVNRSPLEGKIFEGDARRMGEIEDASVALVVTSPPYFAGKEYEEALGEGHVPASYLDYLGMLQRRVRRVRPQARARRAHRRQRGQPRSQALPVPVGRRDRHPPGRARPAAAGRDRLAEGPRPASSCAWGTYQRPANPVLRDLTERVVVASKGRFDRAAPRSGARRGHPGGHLDDHGRVHGGHDRRLGDPERERHARGPSRPVPRRAPPAPDRALHLPRRPRARPVHGLGHDGRGGRAQRSPLRGIRHRLRVRAHRRAARRRGTRRRHRSRRWPSNASARRPGDPRRAARAGGRGGPPQPCPGGEGMRARSWHASCWRGAGSTRSSRTPRSTTGIDVSFSAVDRTGHRGSSTCRGRSPTTRAGLRRTDTLWKALGKAAVLHAVRPEVPVVLLTTDAPPARSVGDRAWRALRSRRAATGSAPSTTWWSWRHPTPSNA